MAIAAGMIKQGICFADHAGSDSTGIKVYCFFTNLNEFENINVVSVLKSAEENYIYKVTKPEARFIIDNPSDSINFFAVYGQTLDDNNLNESCFTDPHFYLRSNICWNILNLYSFDTLKIEQINSYYRIKGFTHSEMILYKYKDEIYFNRGNSSFTIFYNYENTFKNLYNYFPANISYSTNTNIKVIPNPSNGNMAIDIKNDFYGDFILSVISSQGGILFTKKINKKDRHIQVKMNLGNNNSGIYFVRINFNGYLFAKNISII